MNPQNEKLCVRRDDMRALGMIVVMLPHAGRGKTVRGRSRFTGFFSLSESIITYLMLRERERTGGLRTEAYYIRRALEVLPSVIVRVMTAPDRAHLLVDAKEIDRWC